MSQAELLPAPAVVADTARSILDKIRNSSEFHAFRAASLEYSEDWQCFTGFPVVQQWHLETDAPQLFEEGLRALALKAAVHQITGDDQLSEIPIAVPVDEMTHAMLAQAQLVARMAASLDVSVIHQTDQEHTDYRSDSYTHTCYSLAWGEPPARYWLDHEEVVRRRRVLGALYESIGMERSGREHRLTFEPVAA
ncbi:hypothetical protein ACIPSE_45175 [Streptomyces sp. NPDC090106]|uniref:hypothetical protein n=1 Tax=Streptomyces sp. NPDC090106 TaxID=3365946 RepID=UPI003809540D